jgi:Tol biopolymer transport system component
MRGVATAIGWALAAAAVLFTTELFAQEATDERLDLPRSRMMLINPDGTGLRELEAFSDRNVGSPQFSPDGKLIAYDTWTKGFETTTIEVAALDGTIKRKLGKGAMPSWSPDGTQLVFHTYESPQTIVVMDLEGEGRETIMPHWGSPRWSPVGNRIISAMSSGGISIFDLSTGKEWVVAPNHRLWQGQSISPDGTRICFGNSNGGVFLATLNKDATKATVRPIMREGESYHSTWSPDGKTVVFNFRPKPGAIPQLYLCDVDSGKAPRPFPGQDPKSDNRDVHWSRDGKTLVFISVEVRSAPAQ